LEKIPQAPLFHVCPLKEKRSRSNACFQSSADKDWCMAANQLQYGERAICCRDTAFSTLQTFTFPIFRLISTDAAKIQISIYKNTLSAFQRSNASVTRFSRLVTLLS
jgi:hypothetical protein